MRRKQIACGADGFHGGVFRSDVVAFGYGSARLGDRFWYALFGLKEPRL